MAVSEVTQSLIIRVCVGCEKTILSSPQNEINSCALMEPKGASPSETGLAQIGTVCILGTHDVIGSRRGRPISFCEKGGNKGRGGRGSPLLRPRMLPEFVCSQEKPALVLSVYLRKRKVTSPQSKPVVFDEDARYLHFERITNWKNENSTILFFIPPPLTNIKKAAAFFFFCCRALTSSTT